MEKLLYIHGFASCGIGEKSRALKRYFGEDAVLSFDLPFDPNDALSFLEKTVATYRPSLLIGSSLGGFYATFLAERFKLKAVLLNPSVEPYRTLAAYVGENRRFCDGATFTWRCEYLDALENSVREPKAGRYLVLLQTRDEVLDYRIALARYEEHRIIVEYGGNHRFENIEDYLCMIERFWKG